MTDDPIDFVAERQAKQVHLAELEKFLSSVVHINYKKAIEVDISNTEQAIILNEPLTRSDEIENFKLRGELRCLHEMQEVFEDARISLKQRIEELLERENQNTTNTKV